jgi:hypothetical protein
MSKPVIDYTKRLIALEGKDGAEVTAVAEALKNLLYLHGFGCIISNWNVSGLFAQIGAQAANLQQISPRALTLLYASDLAGRLKEIRPALQSGFFVLANQYLHTPTAIAAALGVDPTWASHLFSFAPRPEISLYVRSASKNRHNGTGNGQLSGAGLSGLADAGFGFYEFCLKYVIASRPGYDVKSVEKGIRGYFDALGGSEKLSVIRSRTDQHALMAVLRKLLPGYNFDEAI